MAERRVVTWSATGAVATIMIDNPPHNVINREVRAGLSACLSAVEQDDSVRVLVIAAAGDRFFSPGGDISETPSKVTEEQARALTQEVSDQLLQIDEFPKPTICAVNGIAMGGGFVLAIACDLRVAAENAIFGLPEQKVAVFPGGGGTQRLPRLIGEGRAKELLFTADPIDAHEAHRIGLVNRVVPVGRALCAAQELAARIAEFSSPILRATKVAVHASRTADVAAGLALEVDSFARLTQTEDVQEGYRAFIEKRKPRFQHR